MQNLRKRVAGTGARVRGERGQGLVEYALILALVSLAAIVALGFLSGKINGLFSKAGNSLNTVNVADGGGGGAPGGPGQYAGNSNGTRVVPDAQTDILYGSVTSSANVNTTPTNGLFTFSSASTVSGLAITLSQNNTGGNLLTVTLMRNGAATGIACNIPTGSSTCSSGSSQAYAAGDTMNIRFQRNTGGPGVVISGSWTLNHT